MEPITSSQILSLRNAKQHFSDCYLVSSLNSLTKTLSGQKILSENIHEGEEGFKIRFNNIKGSPKDYFISNKEIDSLILMDKYYNPIEIFEPHNTIVKAVEVAMNKLISDYPFAKPLICRFARCNESFEYNKPSNFMRLFTGKDPITINEDSYKMTMKSKKDELFELLENIGKNNGGSFVLGTGFFPPKLASWHCFTIEEVNNRNKYVHIIENRTKKCLSMSFDKVSSVFKYITGFYDSMLN